MKSFALGRKNSPKRMLIGTTLPRMKSPTNSYWVGFEAALEQTTILHPTIDLSEVNPCKEVVDGKLV